MERRMIANTGTTPRALSEYSLKLFLLNSLFLYCSSGRKVTQLKICIFQKKQFNYYNFLIQVFKTEESETENIYVGKKGHTAHLIYQWLVCMYNQ
jgi:hypothetical protein